MALNLKLDDFDRTVPNCSDESGSDCSSEELIDCDAIVDVTTVTGNNIKNMIQESPNRNTKEYIDVENRDNVKKHVPNKVQVCESTCESYKNRPNETFKELKAVQCAEKNFEKTSSIKNLTSAGKNSLQTKNIGILR